jgi:tetratricopeptide (TPR) repeat protein
MGSSENLHRAALLPRKKAFQECDRHSVDRAQFLPYVGYQHLLVSWISVLVIFNMLIMVLRRRQFYRKISEWGFEKNIKDKEMRALVQDLSQRQNDGEDLTVELRGQQVDPMKIQRWQKRHGKVKDIVRPFSRNPSIGKCSGLSDNPFSRSDRASLAAPSSRILDNINEHELPMETTDCDTLDSPTETTEPSQICDDSGNRGFDHWSLVDVTGSPLLTQLLAALEIECECLIPSVDLNSSNPAAALLSAPETESGVEVNNSINHEEWFDFSKGTGSKDFLRYSREVFQTSEIASTGSSSGIAELSFSEWSFREWDFSRAQPLKMNISHMIGLSPFPVSPDASRHGTSAKSTLSLHTQSQNFQVEEIRCKSRLRKLETILGTENPRTLAAMDHLGVLYSTHSKYRQAERVHRQTVISYQRTLGLKHFKTLYAYVNFICTLYNQGHLLRAYRYLQRIHNTIVGTFDRDEQLVLYSNSLWAKMLCDFGQLDEAEELIRQTFQIGLYTLGPRSKEALEHMRILAEALRRRGKLAESEQLLRINLMLCHQLDDCFSSDFFDRMGRLSDVLSDQGCYDECSDLAMTAVELQHNSMKQRPWDVLYSLFQVAVCTRRQGNLSESERQLRDLIERQIQVYGEEDMNTYLYLEELSGVLGDMGQYTEAVTLLEKCYKAWVNMVGVSHSHTIWCCRQLGKYLIELRRYEGAITLLQKCINDARVHGEFPSKDLLEAISALATCLQKVGRYREAIPHYQECFHGFVEICGLSGSSTIYIIKGLGMCYEGLGHYDDAFALCHQVSDQIRSVEGDEHPAQKQIGWESYLTLIFWRSAPFQRDRLD